MDKEKIKENLINTLNIGLNRLSESLENENKNMNDILNIINKKDFEKDKNEILVLKGCLTDLKKEVDASKTRCAGIKNLFSALKQQI